MNLNGTETPNKWTMRCFTMASSEVMDSAEVIGVFGHTMARRLVEYQNNLVDLLERDRAQLLAENQMLDGAIARLRKQCEDTRIALDASPRVPLAEAAKGYVSAYEDVVSEKMTAEETCERLRTALAGAEKWQAIESAPKEHALLLWFPAFEGHPARAWCGRYSFVEKEWMVQTPGYANGKQFDVSGLPQPTHWQPLPAPPAIGGEKASPGEGLA